MTVQRKTAFPRVIARQLAIGFGAVSVLAIAMCAMLLTIIYDVSGLVAAMRHDEHSIQQGLALATSVRDLSIEVLQALGQPQRSERARYQELRRDVRAQLGALETRLPTSERYRLGLLATCLDAIETRVVSQLDPEPSRERLALLAQEFEALRVEASEQADALAHATSNNMVHAHVMATDSTRLGLIGGGFFAATIVALSIGFTVRLRGAVIQPLARLTEGARRFGNGDFAHRVGQVGQGELLELSDAFDRMADELAHREARMLQNERMAAIGQLAAGVAHELNNPIAIIRGYLKTMSPDESHETLREELAILDEEASHCQRIAEDLLMYARSGELTMDALHSGDFLRETARRFENTANLGSGDIRVEAQDVRLEADGARLRQVVLNLLLNARQASASDQPVILRGRVDGEHYIIEVEDFGPGIEPAQRQRIFEPFYSQRRGGSGLGLAVCLGIVQAHHGTIEAKSSAHGGALFEIRLPRQQTQASPSTSFQRSDDGSIG
jgi:signal transduction histidine kinase